MFSETKLAEIQATFNRLLHADPEDVLQRMRDPASGKIVLNSDDLFRILPQYENRPETRIFLGPALYPVAREFTDWIYKRLLRRCATAGADTVVFTAGGSATGKSSILRSAGQKLGVDFIVDTTFSDVSRGLAQVDRALNARRQVEIHYIYREFRESVISMIQRALGPSSGRIVPIDDMAKTHFGAQRSILEASEKYGEDPRVLIELRANRNKKLLRLSEREFERLLYPSIDELKKIGQSILDEFRQANQAGRRTDDQDRHAGGQGLHFSEAFYEAARSRSEKGGKAPRKGDAGGVSKGN